jgi:hypothetical protein
MRTRLLLPVAACMVLAVPAAAHASYPGKSGNIAVVEGNSDRGGEGDTDLRLLRSSGKVLTKSLQHCAFHEFENTPDEQFCPSSPNFSRDGSKLAYAIDDRLAVANANGSGRVRLPRLTEADGEPVWTKSGELVFTGKQGGKLNLFLVKADGTGLRHLTTGGGRAGAYSSRGLVAYVAKGYVRLIKPNGKGGRRLARGANPDFSPSGATVVYDRKGALFSKGVKRGSKRRRVARHGTDAVYAPTGKRVLYVKNESDGSIGRLYTVTPRGKHRKRLFTSVDLSSAGQSHLAGPAWQPRR